MPLLVTALQYHMVSVGLADMVDDLSAPLRRVGWVVTAFIVASAAVQPVAGKLGDRYGSRTVFTAGLAVFAVTSLACAVAPNVSLLILARVVQGAATGLVTPTAFALVAAAFPERRAQAVGLLSSMIPIGTLLGPNLGGVIVEQFGWRATFLVNVPIGVTMAIAALFVLPAVPGRPSIVIDVRGAVLLAAVVTTFVYGLTELGAMSTVSVVGVLGAAALLAVVFARHERRAVAPIVDVDLFGDRSFAVANVVSFLYGAVLVGLFGFIPLYVQTRYGMSPVESGLVLTPRAIAMVATSALVALLLGRIGLRRPLAAGLALTGGGALVLSLGLVEPVVLGVTFSAFAWTTVVATAIGVAYGLVGPPLHNVGLDRAPDRVAAISGLRGTFRSVGGAVGVAFVVLVVSLSADVATGLELAFAGLGLVALVCVALTRWVPEPLDGPESTLDRAAALTPRGSPRPPA